MFEMSSSNKLPFKGFQNIRLHKDRFSRIITKCGTVKSRICRKQNKITKFFFNFFENQISTEANF